MKCDPNIIHGLSFPLPLTWQHLANENVFSKKDELERYNKHELKLCLSVTRHKTEGFVMSQVTKRD